MKNQSYKKQVELLLDVLPEVAKETCFALHGGTAINLFIRNIPRLSVDIDLTYLPIEDRNTSLSNINKALNNIKTNIEAVLPGARIIHKEDVSKLQIFNKGADIKIEVNQVGRGTIDIPKEYILCDNAIKEFDVSCAMPIMPFGQLYGGKICAALDRQYPRDLFDIKHLLANEGITDEVRKGFILCLLCSDRPMNEVLIPNFQDQRQAMENQFSGMSDEVFTYDDFEEIRESLVRTINASLTAEDKKFLLSVKNCEPDWNIYDFEKFPAVQWKLQNLRKLKEANPNKHLELYKALKTKLYK